MSYRVQIVNLRAVASVDEGFVPPTGQAQADYRPRTAERSVYFADADARRAVPVVSRRDLASARTGPLLIEEFDTTTFVPAGAQARIDDEGQIRIRLAVQPDTSRSESS